MAFIHLHTHSHYSLLNALPKINELVKKAKADGQAAIALTDNGNLYGAIEFYQAAQKNEIKPILGVDFYVAMRTRHDKESRIDNRRYRLIMLAKNNDGWKNLIRLVTISHLDGFYYKPRIDRELIEQNHEGLICILPFFSSELSAALKNNDEERADSVVDFHKKLFGDDLYVEITHHPELDKAMELKEKLVAYCKKNKLQMVAAQDVYFMTPEDREARKTLVSIQSSFGGSGDSPDSNNKEDFSFINQATAEKYFKDLPEALENTVKIAEQCSVELEFKWRFPNYVIDSGREPDDELKAKAYEGVPNRGLSLDDPELKERLDYELQVIAQKGYSKYFLVVGDLLREARERGILTTIRGSVAGSLTTYVLGITNVNPIEYKLPFERFLNPERPSAPDIDMDYADNRRDEMIDYVRNKYGRGNVAQIGTFGTMMARGSVRDTARALGYPYEIGDQISKLIPMGSQGFPMSIERALEEVPELKQLYENDEDAQQIIDMAQKIEGCARHISVHAAGVVISPIPLIEIAPVQYDPKSEGKEEGKIITQWDMHSVGEDAIGLLKFDFLGIRNLAILADAVRLTERIKGVKIDIENIPLDDKKTFEILSKGETIGLFQLNGSGMTRFLKELHPSSIHDINAMVALYRPGPMEMIPEYIQRKHNPKLVKYLDPRMSDILDRSFGVITYQDDVMMIAIKLAGYSWLEADKLRKAMGKKIPELMEAEKKKLREGLLKNGMSEDKADDLWKLIEPFAAYGFNKAHAASYGRVAYQTAYMKANYPSIYMAAVLTAESGDVEKIAEIIAECNRMKIKVLPPDINQSFEGFTVVNSETEGAPEDIRFGLTTIKNFGEGIAHAIMEERKKGGPFLSLEDFLNRVNDRNLNKKSLESLIKAGALDCFSNLKSRAMYRLTLLHNLEYLLTYNKEMAKNPVDAGGLFAGVVEAKLPDLRLAPAPEQTPDQIRSSCLGWEKELLGLYISGHPLDKCKHILEKRDVDIKQVTEKYKEGHPVVIAGLIETVRVIRTKKGDEMAFVRIADYSGSIEAVAFPTIYAARKDRIVPDNCVAVKSRVSKRNGETSLLIEEVRIL